MSLFANQTLCFPGGGGGGSGTGSFPVVTFTGTAKSLVVADDLTFFVMNNASPQTVTIPDEGAQNFLVGAEMDFLREGVGTVTFTISGSAVLHSRSGLMMINSQYGAATLKKIGPDEWRLIGELV